MTYQPQANSFAGLAVAFFRANDDEELSTYDLGQKFGAGYKSIHTLLRPAIDAGLLARYRDDEGDYIYKAGANIHAKPTAKAKHKPQPKPETTPKPHGGNLFATNTSYSRALIEQLPVATDRVFSSNGNTKGQSKWTPLMNRLTSTGQSVVFPGGWRNAVTKAVCKFNRDHRADPATDFVYRVTSQGGQACLWRMPK